MKTTNSFVFRTSYDIRLHQIHTCSLEKLLQECRFLICFNMLCQSKTRLGPLRDGTDCQPNVNNILPRSTKSMVAMEAPPCCASKKMQNTYNDTKHKHGLFAADILKGDELQKTISSISQQS